MVVPSLFGCWFPVPINAELVHLSSACMLPPVHWIRCPLTGHLRSISFAPPSNALLACKLQRHLETAGEQAISWWITKNVWIYFATRTKQTREKQIAKRTAIEKFVQVFSAEHICAHLSLTPHAAIGSLASQGEKSSKSSKPVHGRCSGNMMCPHAGGFLLHGSRIFAGWLLVLIQTKKLWWCKEWTLWSVACLILNFFSWHNPELLFMTWVNRSSRSCEYLREAMQPCFAMYIISLYAFDIHSSDTLTSVIRGFSYYRFLCTYRYLLIKYNVTVRNHVYDFPAVFPASCMLSNASIPLISILETFDVFKFS